MKSIITTIVGTRCEDVFEHIEHRRRGVAVQDGRHRAHVAQTGGVETAEDQPVVGTVIAVAGAREAAQTEDVGRGHQAPVADRTGPERRRTAGRALVVLPVAAVAHEKRVEAQGRHIVERAQAQKTVQLTNKSPQSPSRSVRRDPATLIVFAGPWNVVNVERHGKRPTDIRCTLDHSRGSQTVGREKCVKTKEININYVANPF